MPTFITTGRLTKAGADGLMAKPEDRLPALKALADAAGTSIKAYYLTTGRNDFVLISEAPNAEAAVSALMVAVSSGSVTNVETVQAWSSAEFAGIAKAAGDIAASYRAPGT